MIRKYLFLLTSFILHLVILTAIFKLWLPIPKWYLSQMPARGIDLFNSVSYLTYLVKYFVLPFNGWKYTWFAGMPWGWDYPVPYLYLMLPLTKFFSIPQAVQVFALGGSFAFTAFSYLLFATVSKNRVLAALLALGVAYSVNIWRALVYAGGIPFFMTQAMFPLILLLVVKFIQSQNRRWLILGALVSGLGFMGHPQSFINFIFPTVFILLAFSSFAGLRFLSWEKVKNLALYAGLTILVGFPEFYRLFFSNFILRVAGFFNVNLLGITPPETTTTAPRLEVVEWARNQFYVSFSATNPALFHLLGALSVFFVLGLLLGQRRKKAFLNTVAVALVAAWVIFYIYLLSIGINIYHGGWEAWYKLFWAVPVAVGFLASQFWGVFATSLAERFQSVRGKTATVILEIVSGVILILLGGALFPNYTRGVIEQIEDISVFSSNAPEAVTARLTSEGQARVKREATPSFLNDSPGEYRVYANDQTFNIWWSSLFSTPLARGYIDPPLSLKERWGFFWLDAAFGVGAKGGTSLGDDWKTPEEVVSANIAFLLDWYAIKYLEGNHSYQASLGKFPSLLTSDKFVTQEEEPEVLGGLFHPFEGATKLVWNDTFLRKMHFYRIKDELVSPIHQATNAPAVLVIGGGDSYDIITRFFGMMGFSSQEVIMAQGPQFIDEVSASQMRDFDAIFLYKYDYKNYSKSWKKVEGYLKNGGKVFIDTGAEVKESSSVELPGGFSKTLPEFFPIKQTKRADLGREWQAEIGDRNLFSEVSVETFSPLEFDNKPWNISYSPGGQADIRQEAKVLLSLRDYPVLAERSFGQGKIIWSGLNLPYHALRNYNFDEGKLLVNVFSRLFEFGQKTKPESNLNWVSPQKRVISSMSAKGVLFKEQAFPGWTAQVSSPVENSNLKIYKVGPTSPGFIYVRVPEKFRETPFKVTFSYRGSFKNWIINLISLLAVLFAGDYIFLRQMFTGRIVRPVFSWLNNRVASWWEKEEEE